MAIEIGGGINVGGQITIGGGAPIVGGTITYAQMGPPVVAGYQLEDSTATVNGSVGFTINNGGAGGVAVLNLTPSNITFFDNQGIGYFTASFGPGSSYASATVGIVATSGPLIFYIDPGLSYPATFNYPFIIS